MGKIVIGQKINGRYRLTSRLAQGGTAEVYEAQDLVHKRNCAVKFILEELLNKPTNITRFEREANIVSKLSHSNIVRVYESGVFENRPYIVLEYLNGQTLSEKLKLDSRLSYLEICNIILQVCDALVYLHMHGIVHRDIKPDNIYYFYDGKIKLADFGVALDLTNKRKEDMILMGSVDYMAPELVSRHPDITKLVDIYSLGITFYELVTHQLPFHSDNPLNVAINHIEKEIIPPSQIVNDLPKPIEKIILKATMKNPVERYQSAREMRQDLLELLQNKKKYAKRGGFMKRLFGFR